MCARDIQICSSVRHRRHDRLQLSFFFHAEHFDAHSLPHNLTLFDGRSDYGPFIAVGIPAGGLATGTDALCADILSCLCECENSIAIGTLMLCVCVRVVLSR